MRPGKLMVLQDSPDFGGHEAMFLRFLPALLEGGAFQRIVIRFAQNNVRLHDALRALASPILDARPWPYAKRRAEPYLASFRLGYARAVRSLIDDERPSALLLLQGRIENLAVPMLAAPADTFLVSYVPMAHGMADIGRAPVPGDIVRRRLYRRPNRFIVPSSAVAAQVRSAGGRNAVVVHNVVSPPPRRDRSFVRRALGLPTKRRISLVLGRLDIRQKGLDLLIDAIRRDVTRLSEWTFLIVGDGEGRAAFTALAAECDGRIDVRQVGWSDRPHDFLAAADLLLMPSRWEGVPLTMLEAISYGVPVLGSDIDVFREYLPACHRIDFDSARLSEAMERAVVPSAAARTPIGGETLATSSALFAAALQP